MKTNKLMDSIRDTISPEIKKQTELSVSIANRIYEILEEKKLTQKDLAHLLGKTETEVSRWLSGTHNLTMATIAKISTALGEDIIQTTLSKNRKVQNKKIALL
ncbi:MAG: helix-turn-helix transcriptional regulator [Bacteroidales bacterium]|nr:helix-turn-helix transcriptional regulator [Bacteroidales bacterium]MCQ2270881.1 helix-turn-helix transcriptional regulator [Bacteroidales bacterium]MCQ2285899.1 helix-turn-helix transcriptional regulator [Bacteroidales bacterium]